MDQFMLKLNGLGAQLNPLAKNIERGFGQVKRYAEEKLGTAGEITELPRDFLELELKVNAIRELLTTMVKSISAHSSTTPTNVEELAKAINGVTGAALISPGTNEKQTYMHLIGKTAESTSKTLMEEPFGAALDKFGTTYGRLGEAKLILDQEVENKFLSPAGKIIQNSFAEIARARKNVTNLRLSLDSIKSTQKSANPQRAEAMQMEVERAEDAFIEAVEECQRLMKKIIESNVVMSLIHQLVILELAYHKQCVQAITNLVPELDEMMLTHEALYNSSPKT